MGIRFILAVMLAVCIWGCQEASFVYPTDSDSVEETDGTGTGRNTETDGTDGVDTETIETDTGTGAAAEMPCYELGESPEGKAFPCDWVTLEGGSYMMGAPEGTAQEVREYPQHLVDVPTFRLWRTENTVDNYLACMNAGACEPPVVTDDYFCNIGYPGRGDYPANCIDWPQADNFCRWLGGRLPSEAEWEFAARSRGRDIIYPWGDEKPDCDRAIIDVSYIDAGTGAGGCDDIRSTRAACSKPLGNSDQGLCDFVGNVYEWVEDFFHEAYLYERNGVTYTAPTDGSAWMDPPDPYDFRVMKGGGIGSPEVNRPSARQFHGGEFAYGGLGVRCAQDL